MTRKKSGRQWETSFQVLHAQPGPDLPFTNPKRSRCTPKGLAQLYVLDSGMANLLESSLGGSTETPTTHKNSRRQKCNSKVTAGAMALRDSYVPKPLQQHSDANPATKSLN